MTRKKTKKPAKPRKCPTLDIQFAELKAERTKTGRAYIVWIPGFGNPGCTVQAKNVTKAKKVVGEFIGNELMTRKVLYAF